MKRARLFVATFFVVGTLLGPASPAAALPVDAETSRSGRLCITFHTGGIFDPIPVCIPLI